MAGATPLLVENQSRRSVKVFAREIAYKEDLLGDPVLPNGYISSSSSLNSAMENLSLGLTVKRLSRISLVFSGNETYNSLALVCFDWRSLFDLAPSKGWRPVRHSQKITPRDHISEATTR